MRFDLVIKGGQVVDPGGGQSGLLDIGDKGSRIAAVDRDIPASSAFQVVDAREQVVTPGLVDLHAHVFHGVTYWGVRADPIAARTGVTTWVDAGSAGAMTIGGFREFIVRPALVRVYAFLNISYIGLVGPDYELMNPEYVDTELFERVANLNRDLVLGVKVRMMSSTVGENGVEPLARARKAADSCELPLMMHIGYAPPEIDDCLPYLRGGDILTHCFTGFSMRILDDHARLRTSAKKALDAGVILDLGHGSGAFWFEVAEALVAQGHKPDIISTDIHQLSVMGPMYDLPTCMSKCLCLGMSLEEVVRATTIRPAEVLGLDRELGTLRPGAFADIALFEIESGRWRFYDINMEMREGKQRLRNTLTVVGGRPLNATPPDPPAPWLSDDFVWPQFQASLVQQQRNGLAQDQEASHG